MQARPPLGLSRVVVEMLWAVRSAVARASPPVFESAPSYHRRPWRWMRVCTFDLRESSMCCCLSSEMSKHLLVPLQREEHAQRQGGLHRAHVLPRCSARRPFRWSCSAPLVLRCESVHFSPWGCTAPRCILLLDTSI
jgi:hypothetical protein